MNDSKFDSNEFGSRSERQDESTENEKLEWQIYKKSIKASWS